MDDYRDSEERVDVVQGGSDAEVRLRSEAYNSLALEVSSSPGGGRVNDVVILDDSLVIRPIFFSNPALEAQSGGASGNSADLLVVLTGGERSRITPPTDALRADAPRADAPLDPTYSALGTGDTAGRRYTTTGQDSAGGSNAVDLDRLGVPFRFAWSDQFGRNTELTGSDLTRLLTQRDGQPIRHWRAVPGPDGGTIVTAPDGLTRYNLDASGRLRSDAGSVRAIEVPSILAFRPTANNPNNMIFYESAGPGGERRTVVTDAMGGFNNLFLSSEGRMRSITARSWAGLAADQSRDLGDGWMATRMSRPGGNLPTDSVRLSHRDGSTYFITPDGLLSYAQGPGGSPRDAISLPTRLPVATSAVEVGPLRDRGTRYQTPDRRGSGSNSIDVDQLGVVHSIAHTDAQGLRRSLSLSSLSDLEANGQPRLLPGGWRASRTGVGADMETTVVAPDGSTTYRLDSLGRIIGGRSSVDVPPGAESTTVPLGAAGDTADKSARTEVLMADGGRARAVAAADGRLSHVTVRGTTTNITITRQQWERVLTSPTDMLSLGSGWSAIRTGTVSGGIPAGSIWLMHEDGTAFLVGPEGRIRHSAASSRARIRR